MSVPELAGGVPLRMFLRVVRVSEDGALAGGPDPTFKLAAGGGEAVPLPRMLVDAQAVRIVDGNQNFVAEAGFTTEPLDTFLITVNVFFQGNTWTLQIVNNDDAAREFTVVAADNDGPDDGARQPWIHAEPTLSLSVPEGAVGPFSSSLIIANRGTGPLTVESGGLKTPFQVQAPGPIEPNSVGTMTVVCSPGDMRSANQSLSIVSNDTTARASRGHNNVVAVSFSRSSPVDDRGENGHNEQNDTSCTICSCTQYRPGFHSLCKTSECGHAGISHRHAV